MRRIIYESVSTDRSAEVIAPDILRAARPENGLNGVTGLLLADADRFLQVLEGPEESVAMTFDRIRLDRRHHDITVLADDAIDERSFADWAMAYREEGHPAEIMADRLRQLIARAPSAIGEHIRRFSRA